MPAHQVSENQRQILVLFGQRLRFAREELCRMTLSDAAAKLGYENPSKLSKVEHASDTQSIPTWLIPAAAGLYNVSTDFLFGISEDWETDVVVRRERAVEQYVITQMTGLVSRNIEAGRSLKVRVDALASMVLDLAIETRNHHDAVNLFAQRNAEFEDMPAGAPVLAGASRLKVLAGRAESALLRMKAAHPQIVENVPNPKNILSEAIRELADMSELEYEQARSERADTLGVRVRVLDNHVKAARTLRYGRHENQRQLFSVVNGALDGAEKTLR